MSIEVAAAAPETYPFALLDDDDDALSCSTGALTVKVSNVFPERK
jgi:hypothetical protein